jgi:hypothetical protein
MKKTKERRENLQYIKKVTEVMEYSVEDVSDRTGIPYRQILRFLREGYIRGRRIGKGWSIPGKEVMDIIAGKNEAIMKDLAIDNTPLLETFDYGGIIVKTTRDVIEKCGSKYLKKTSRYYYATKRNRCPRCLILLSNGRCPRCDWPGLKKPTQLSNFGWQLFLMRRQIWLRREYIQAMAHAAVKKALKEGRLTKPHNCNFCGTEGRLEAHHWSYEPEHWLDVIWYCIKCHRDWHARKTAPLPLWTVIDIEINDVSEL